MKFSAVSKTSGYISVNELLFNTDQLSVWHKLLGQFVNIGDKFCNTLRGRLDSKPGCWLEHGIYKTNRIVLNDFGDKKFHGMDIIQATMHQHQLEYSEALHWIKNEFKVEVRIYNLPPFRKDIHKNKTPISYTPKHFSLQDKNYWQPLGITSKQLYEDDVHTCSYYILYSTYYVPNSLCYIYNFPSGNKKIYQPFSEKKWINNCNNNDIGQYEKLPDTGDLLLIQKSYKDSRIMRNLGFNSIWFQNEGILITPKLAKELSSRFKHIIFFYDNDSAGIQGAVNNMNYANSQTTGNKFDALYLPIQMYEQSITDPAELLLDVGLDKGNKLLNNLITKI